MTGMASRRRTSARTVVVGLAAASVLISGVGAAWALGTTRTRPFNAAATYQVALTPTGFGEAGAVTQDVRVMKIGDALLSAQCSVSESADVGIGIGVGVFFTVTNTGDNPLVVAISGEKGDNPGNQFVWLAPDQQDAVFAAGQFANETGDYASVFPVSISDVGGTSVTGLASVSGFIDRTDHIGYCTFSVQARG
jgi:hypothetical protein